MCLCCIHMNLMYTCFCSQTSNFLKKNLKGYKIRVNIVQATVQYIRYEFKVLTVSNSFKYRDKS